MFGYGGFLCALFHTMGFPCLSQVPSNPFGPFHLTDFITSTCSLTNIFNVPSSGTDYNSKSITAKLKASIIRVPNSKHE